MQNIATQCTHTLLCLQLLQPLGEVVEHAQIVSTNSKHGAHTVRGSTTKGGKAYTFCASINDQVRLTV